MVHFKVKKWVESEDLEMKSKEIYHFETGFRRFQGYPLFSKIATVSLFDREYFLMVVLELREDEIGQNL